uniref:Vomeronasal type-1 receptor n=1 Tax=Ditylenchus dipsaci TaxID=166011 RepID=A0A915DQ07_9BILA
MAIVGAVFCSYPTFIYFAGVFGNFCWVTESSTSIILAANRCIEMISPSLSEKLFEGKRSWCWMALTCLYGLSFVTFTRPVLFNGIMDAGGLTYANKLHTFHNNAVCLALLGLYALFVILYIIKSTVLGNQPLVSRHNAAAQRTAFLQVLVISCVNAVGSGIYDYMQMFPVTEALILVASYSWCIIHGMPSIIFLTMNRTIRHDCIRMFYSTINLCRDKKVGPAKYNIATTSNNNMSGSRLSYPNSRNMSNGQISIQPQF